MDEENKSSIYFDFGKSYAEKVNFVHDLLKEGFYSVTEDLFIESNLIRENEKKILERFAEEIKNIKEFILKKDVQIASLSINLKVLEDEKKDFDVEYFERKKKYDDEIESKNIIISEIKKEHWEKEKNKGNYKKSWVYKLFYILIFSSLTIGLLMFYWAAWYNGFFNNVLQENLRNVSNGIGERYGSVLNPYFLYKALEDDRNYYALIMSFMLNGIPLAISYILHKGIHDILENDDSKKGLNLKKHGYIILSLIIAMVIDYILAYKIVEELYDFKVFVGTLEKNNLNVFSDISFYLIMVVCFVAYYIWGHFLLKLIHFNDSDLELKRKIVDIRALIDDIKKQSIIDLDSIKENISDIVKKINKTDQEIKCIEAEKDNAEKDVLGIEKNVLIFDSKLKISKNDLLNIVNAFFSGFVTACNYNMNNKKSIEFCANLSGLKNEKEAYINSVLNDERYVVL